MDLIILRIKVSRGKIPPPMKCRKKLRTCALPYDLKTKPNMYEKGMMVHA